MQDEKEYRDWLKKFYEGSFLISGWNAVKNDLLKRTGPAERKEIESRIDRLGETIGGEWAKDNSIRKIDSDDLRRWSGRLQSSAVDPAELERLLAEIETEAREKLGAG